MSDGENYHAHDQQQEGRPPIPSDDDVTALINMVQSFAVTYQSNLVELQAAQLRLSAAEMRAQTAENLLRKLYTATIRHFSAEGKFVPAEQAQSAEAASQAA